jgi:hypothetical protein
LIADTNKAEQRERKEDNVTNRRIMNKIRSKIKEIRTKM